MAPKMITSQIKPSETKSWDVIKYEPASKQSMAVKTLLHPEWYNFYINDGIWYPHRKPTISEIINNQFK